MMTPILPLMLATALSLGAVPLPVMAETLVQQTVPTQPAARPEVALLVDTLLMTDVAEVMRDEGIAHGATLEAEMLSGRGGTGWSATVRRIYDPERMLARFTARLDRELAGQTEAVRGMQDFFAGPLGSRILTLELDARRALADKDAEEAARITVEDMMADRDPRIEALRALAEASDLVEQNVTGALNANLAFYQGMADGGALGAGATEEQMLSDVWSQEPDVRAETERWLYSYMVLAYAPLSDAELADYQVFSESEAGRVMNAALFAAFDETFVGISHDLGRAVAGQMQGQDI